MHLFEALLALLIGATILSSVARRLKIPYPTVLAVGGGLVAFVPSAPQLNLPPDLILALFVAPVLLDAAYDASLRDLRRNWVSILSLVLVAVVLTTIAVAVTARLLIPGLPWPAAIALGALLAPPDAVAALAVLRQIAPPHRLRMVLEGESLLNDASALLIYRLAVGAVAAGSFEVADVAPTFLIVVFGSVAAGWLIAWPLRRLIAQIDDAPSSVIVQFATTFAIWLAAERLGLSGVVTIVVYALTIARRAGPAMPARLRVPSFAIWETVTFLLNVVAFTLIGLRIRPTLAALDAIERRQYLVAALIILAVVIAVRLLWVMAHNRAAAAVFRLGQPGRGTAVAASLPPSMKSALIVGWSGMRGIVTLAAAMALPANFPYRDFIQLVAFVVVLGTLVIQGLTLRPLLQWLRLPMDNTVEQELTLARKTVLKAALALLEGDDSPGAEHLRLEYGEALSHARLGHDPGGTPDNLLRKRTIAAARDAVEELRRSDAIGDDAYHRVEEELDWLELSSGR